MSLKHWLASVAVVVVGVLTAGRAVADPNISVADTSFDSVRVAETAETTVTRVINIRNDGADPLIISSYALAGPDAADFEITVEPATPTTVAATGTTSVTVVFDPDAPGAKVASLDIASNDPADPVLHVALTGTGTSAIISVTDPVFPLVTQGTSLSRNIAVSNTGSPAGPLRVTAAMISGGTWFTFDTNAPHNCSGQMCVFAGTGFDVPPTTNIAVRCSPPANAMGSQSAMVIFASDTEMTGSDGVSMVTCTAGRADISVLPTSLAYGDVLVNPSIPPSKTVTVDNTGNQDLLFTASKTGAFAARYTFGGCHSACNVAPGTSQQFTVAFNPNAPTTPDANITVTLTSNDPDNATVEIAVTGRGVAPAVAMQGPTAFGNVEVGKMSTTRTLTVQNTGTAPLTISNAQLVAGAADYTVLAGTVGNQMTMLAPNASVSWDLVCNPSAKDARPGTFRVASNAFNLPTLDLGLTCFGQLGQLVVSVAPSGKTIDFGGVPQGSVVPRTFTLRNTGNVAVTGIASVLVPSNTGYSLDPATPVPAMLAAGASVSLTARFAPQSGADGGAATITFTGGWGTTPTQTMDVLTLAGDGLTAGFDLTPAAINFGDLRWDTTPIRKFCIVNTDQAAVTINSMAVVPGMSTVTDEFIAETNTIMKQTTCGVGGSLVTLPQTLASGEILEVTVRADPLNRIGMMQATVVVTSLLAMNPTRSLALTGNSTSAGITLAPGPMIDFGGVDVQGAAAAQTITITNTGDGPLELRNFSRTPDPRFTVALPPGTTEIAPAGTLDLVVSFKPVVAGANVEIEITNEIVGVLNGPMGQAILVKGHGIDRKLELLATPTFPDTFRNPGDQAPVRAAKISNSGDAPLVVSAVMITNDTDVWQLVDPSPVEIPKNATHEFLVRFSPKRANLAPPATLQIVNDDDTQPLVSIDLVGNGIDRNVQFGPDIIRLGYTGLGVPVTLDDALLVKSLDPDHTFQIRSIALVGDAPFAIEGTTEGVELPALAERRFGVTFTPETQGPFTAKVRLFLDMDDDYQHEVTIEGTAVFVDAHGGGGCSTSGGGSGALALIGLALAVGRRRRRRLALVAAAALLPGVAAADDIVLSVFDPVPATTSNGFQLQSPDVGASGDWVASAVFSHATDPLVLSGISGGALVNDIAVVERSTMIDVGLAVAFLGRFEAGARMPLYQQDGEPRGDPQTMFTVDPAKGTARGDLTLHAKMRLWKKPLEGRGAFILGLGAQLTLPTATDAQFTGVDKPSGRAALLGSLLPGAFQNRITLSVNLGSVIRARSEYANLEQKSGLAWGLGLQIRTLDALWLAGEVYGDVMQSGRTDAMNQARTLSPIEWLGGLRWKPDHRFTVGLAAGRGLTSAVGAPAFRGVLSLTFAPGAEELRPIHLPKPDGDADGDGLRDSVDRCPTVAEDMDLFDDTDGCPDADNDNDGIADALDKCPLEAEDLDNVDDGDGCIDKDNDGDGIADTLDKCPMVAEDKDGFQDTDGCPDNDNDRDGFPDATDKCPAQAETINGNQDDDGCPDKGDSAVVLSPDRLETMDSIQFTPQHKIAKASQNLMAQIAATLRAHSEIVRMRVTVHVQPTADAAKDQELTDKRAAAVREWLVQWGIDASRVEVRGFGGTKPMVAPDRKGAALLNQRVELIILERK